jgi:integrase
MRAQEGTVFPYQNRSGKTVWKVEVTVGHYPDGRRRRVRKTAETKTEALRLKHQLLHDAHTGALAAAGNERFGEFATWWLETVKKDQVRPATYADYKSRYMRWIGPVFGRRRLADITSRDIANWMADISKRGYASKTINGSRQILRMILQAAVDHDRLHKNPALAVPAKKTQGTYKYVQPAWNKEEATAALRALQGTELELPIVLAMVLGLRRGETLGLKWSDFNFEDGTGAISRARREYRDISFDGKTRNLVETTEVKTSSSNRTLRMGALVQNAVMSHREILQEKGYYDVEGWVFATRSDNPISPTRLSKMFHEFQEQQGLRRIRFHDLRRTAAGLSLSAGTRLEAVSQVLGHSRIDITKAIYAPKVEALGDEYVLNIDSYLLTSTGLNPMEVSHVE